MGDKVGTSSDLVNKILDFKYVLLSVHMHSFVVYIISWGEYLKRAVFVGFQTLGWCDVVWGGACV